MTSRHIRMATPRPHRIGLHQGPGALVSHQRRQHRMVELVTAPNRAIGAHERQAGQRQVADGIKRLVADKLIPEARTLWVEHPRIADHDRVLERRPKRIARAPELADVPHETERPRPRDVAPEYVWRAVERQFLAPNQRMIEGNLGL